MTTRLINFAWSGSTVFHATLAPEEERIFSAWATFSSEGVYDVNRWKMSVELLETCDVLSSPCYIQTPNLMIMVFVEND